VTRVGAGRLVGVGRSGMEDLDSELMSLALELAVAA